MTKHKKLQHPVALVWRIASKLGPKAERKAILAACEKAGVNKFTAATQVQLWRHASPAERARRTA